MKGEGTDEKFSIRRIKRYMSLVSREVIYTA